MLRIHVSTQSNWQKIHAALRTIRATIMCKAMRSLYIFQSLSRVSYNAQLPIYDLSLNQLKYPRARASKSGSWGRQFRRCFRLETCQPTYLWFGIIVQIQRFFLQKRGSCGPSLSVSESAESVRPSTGYPLTRAVPQPTADGDAAWVFRVPPAQPYLEQPRWPSPGADVFIYF